MTSPLTLSLSVSLAFHSVVGVAYWGLAQSHQHGSGTAAVYEPRPDKEIEFTVVSAEEVLAEPAPEKPKEVAVLALPAPMSIPKPILKSVTKFTRRADAPPPKTIVAKPASKAPAPAPAVAKSDAPLTCTGQCTQPPSAVPLATQKGPEPEKTTLLASAAGAGTLDTGASLGSWAGSPNGSPGGTGTISGATVRYRRNPPPAYPKRALQRHMEGTVLLEVRVRENGLPAEIKIKETSGFSTLDEAALDGVKHWEFEPASLSGQALSAWVEVPVRFHLTPAEK